MNFNLKNKIKNYIKFQNDFEKELEKYRYERKFVISELNSREVELQIKLHPALFSEIYDERNINNIYFDSLNFNNYLSNVLGISQREKVRIRWYGELFGKILKPVLELKNKHGHLGIKESYILVPFVLDDNIRSYIWNNFFKKSNIPDFLLLELKSVNPTLINSYKRKYFLSKDKKVRVTIDRELKYFDVINGSKYSEHNIILEIKYNYSNEESINRITDYLNLRLSKNSKYVNGIKSQFYLNNCVT